LPPQTRNSHAAAGSSVGREWFSSYRKLLSETHPWIAPFGAHPVSHFTIPQRIMVLFVVIMVQLFCNGLFFAPDKKKPEEVAAQTAIALAVSIPVTIAASLLCRVFFEGAPRSADDARYTYSPSEENIDAAFAALSDDRKSTRASDPNRAIHLAVALEDANISAAGLENAAESKPVSRIRLTSKSSARSVQLLEGDLREVCRSFKARRRHLCAVTLQSLLSAHSSASKSSNGVTSVAGVCQSLGISLSADGAAPIDAAGIVNLALQTYAGHRAPSMRMSLPDPVAADNSTATERDLTQLRDELYGNEMNGVAWRLGMQFSLAEALFTMHLLIDHPDLYLVLFDAPVPQAPEEVFAAVCAVAADRCAAKSPVSAFAPEVTAEAPAAVNTTTTTEEVEDRAAQHDEGMEVEQHGDGDAEHTPREHVSVIVATASSKDEVTSAAEVSVDSSVGLNAGRAWAQLLAVHLGLIATSEDYDRALRASPAADPVVLSVLLGLHEATAPVIEGGCTPHLLAIETENEVPCLGQVPGLSLRTDGTTAHTGHVSVVLQSHALRLVPKAYVDSRWARSHADRAASIQAPPGKCPTDVAYGAAASSRNVLASYGKDTDDHSLQVTFPLPTPAPEDCRFIRLSDLTEAIVNSPATQAAKVERNVLSRFRYSPATSGERIGIGSQLLNRLSPVAHQSLFHDETSHSNFYATIECGRLMAMLHSVRHGKHTMQSFAAAYRAECAQLASIQGTNITLSSSTTNHKGSNKLWAQQRYETPEDREKDLAAAKRTIASSNHFRADANLTDPVMHRLVSAAFVRDELELGAASAAFTHFAMDSSVLVRFAVASPSAADAPALTRLAMLHPPIAAGCGTPSCPHIGIVSACNGAMVSERIDLLPGRYDPIALSSIAGTMTHTLVVAPLGYSNVILRETAAAKKNPLPALSASGEAEHVVGKAGDDVGVVPVGALELRDAPILHRQLTPSQRDEIARCIIAPSDAHVDREYDDEEAPPLAKDALIRLHRCEHLRICGIELHGSKLGATSQETTESSLRHCLIKCQAPYRTTTEPLATEETNQLVTTAGKFKRMLWSQTLPTWVRWPGYLINLGIFVFFALFALFLTANFTEDTANEWIARSAITAAVTAIFIQPVTTAGSTVFSFTNTVIISVQADPRAFA
jgi:hypothetical protein